MPDDRVLSKAIGRYDCVAVQCAAVQGGKTVGELGYPFVAALDFRRYTYVICRNTPAQSEAGKALAYVRLDRACLATNDRRDRHRLRGPGHRPDAVPDASGCACAQPAPGGTSRGGRAWCGPSGAP